MERKTKIKDMSYMSYEEDDEKDFHVKTVADETLITPAAPTETIGSARESSPLSTVISQISLSIETRSTLPAANAAIIRKKCAITGNSRFYRIKKYLNMYDRIHSAAKRRQQ